MSETVDTLKQRVVGAFVIISLAVIFLPMIFDEPRVTQSNIIIPVPPRPDFKVIEIEKPQAPQFEEVMIDEDTNKVVVRQEQFTMSDAPSDSEKTEIQDVAKSAETATAGNASTADMPSPKKQNKTPSVAHLPVFKNVWMVQLGTFSQRDNAFSLRDQLRKDGFDGHTKEIELGGKPAIRVFTGPFVDKKEAEKIKLKVDKKYKLESQVIFFDA